MIMALASFSGILRTIIILILIFYLIKFLFRIFAPIILQKVVQKAQQGFQHQQQNMQYGNRGPQHTTVEEKPKEKKKVGEYIDYEEIE